MLNFCDSTTFLFDGGIVLKRAKLNESDSSEYADDSSSMNK